jgi:hypothetical protein
MALQPVTAVTPDLLSMTWASAEAARLWFKRRQNTPDALGLQLREFPSDKGLRVRAVVAVLDAKQNPEAFEAWAMEVDILLSGANEEPETDRKLEDLFSRGIDATRAFELIVEVRSQALEAEAAAADEPMGLEADQEMREQDADEERLRLAGTDDGTGPDLIDLGENPVPGGPLVIGEPGVVSREAWEGLGESVGENPMPGVEEVTIVEGAEHPGVTIIRSGNLSDVEQAHIDHQLAKSMQPAEAPVSEAVALTSMAHPTTTLLPEGEFLGDLLFTLDDLDMTSDKIVEIAAKVVRERVAMMHAMALAGAQAEPQAGLPGLPESAPESPEEPPPATHATTRSVRAEALRVALEAPGGASAKELQALLGWKKLPNPWHLKEMATGMGRIADLDDLGLVEGVRRWQLRVRRR